MTGSERGQALRTESGGLQRTDRNLIVSALGLDTRGLCLPLSDDTDNGRGAHSSKPLFPLVYSLLSGSYLRVRLRGETLRVTTTAFLPVLVKNTFATSV